ncbi:hypothetical protein B0A49_13679, partial [Cryomyces minteri]
MGFIDDFTAWATERWSRESGATFEADKTGFIHFTRAKAKKDDSTTLRFFDATIRPQGKIKILGVTMDSALRMDAHVERVTTSATKKCLALGRLRGIRPKQMRQLYRSVVIPTMDYAVSTWYATGRRGTARLVHELDKVQRLGAQAIVGAFRSVSLEVLQGEAALEPTEKRLSRKVARHTASVLALPEDHPLE